MPPSAETEQGIAPPLVWGVANPEGNMVLASEIHSGLWIVKYTAP